MKKRTKKTVLIISIVSIILLLAISIFLVIKLGLLSQSILGDTSSLTFTKDINYNTIQATALSSIDFGFSGDDTCSIYRNIVAEDKLRIEASGETLNNNICFNSYSSYTTIIKTNNLNINNNLKKLDFSFSSDGSLGAGWSATDGEIQGGSTEVYLANPDKEVLLYSSPSLNLCFSDGCGLRIQNYQDINRIILYENLGSHILDINGEKTPIDLTNENYELVIVSKISNGGRPQGVNDNHCSNSENIYITSLSVEYLDENNETNGNQTSPECSSDSDCSSNKKCVNSVCIVSSTNQTTNESLSTLTCWKTKVGVVQSVLNPKQYNCEPITIKASTCSTPYYQNQIACEEANETTNYTIYAIIGGFSVLIVVLIVVIILLKFKKK